MATLKQQAVSSVKWNAVSQVFKLGVYFLTSVVLARLLQPADFGLLGMATVFTSLVAVFNDFGLGSAIIQQSEPDENILSNIFWLNLMIGILAMAVTYLAAPWIAAFYAQPLLRPLLALLSLSFLLTSLGQVQLALLMKRIEFKRVAVVESVSILAGSAAAILLAFFGQGVWALAVQILLTAAVSSLLVWIVAGWRPALKIGSAGLKNVLGFSGGLFGFNLLNYFSRNADYFLIGKFLGASPLGQYTFAYRLMQFPIQNIGGVINRVLFPTLAQVKDNDGRFVSGYLQATRMIALVTFPLMAAMLCLAPELVLVVFGPKWQPAVPVIQVLALIGAIQSVSGIVGNIYTVKGRTDWLLYWGIASSIVIVAGIAIGLRWGILGVAVGYACAALLLQWPNFAIPFRLIGLSLGRYVKSLASLVGLAALMGGVMYASAALQRMAGWPQTVILISNILLGGLVYLILAVRFERAILEELLRTALGKSADGIMRFLPIPCKGGDE